MNKDIGYIIKVTNDKNKPNNLAKLINHLILSNKDKTY